ncbi:MAG: hypothetical protein QHH06_02795 [Clostridiales bacterium]|nr:hypothetical protein [Eubacteriales bacterium]MDH7565397.1 hypothetical protein [Clostridiales bacterium]
MPTNFFYQISFDIGQCDEVILSNEADRAEKLVKLLVGVYSKHIDQIHSGLTLKNSDEGSRDYFSDLKVLKAKLEILKTQVENNLYKPQGQNQSGFVINNSAVNKSSNNYAASKDANIAAYLENLRQEIRDNEFLSSDETNEILDRIDEIEQIAGDPETKKEKWLKLRQMMGWISTKGPDVGLKLMRLILVVFEEKKG